MSDLPPKFYVNIPLMGITFICTAATPQDAIKKAVYKQHQDAVIDKCAIAYVDEQGFRHGGDAKWVLRLSQIEFK